MFDEQFVPSLTGAHQYNSRVAANVIRTVRRELQERERQAAEEWAGLERLLGNAERPSSLSELTAAIRARTEHLCERIRSGDADEGTWRAAVIAHTKDVVRGKLEVANPKWLLPDNA